MKPLHIIGSVLLLLAIVVIIDEPTPPDIPFQYTNTGEVRILNVRILERFPTRVRINIVANTNVQAQIEYGKTIAYGQTNVKEKTFNYHNHHMTLSNLQPNTTYHFRVHIWGRKGTKITSNDMSFTTPKSY